MIVIGIDPGAKGALAVFSTGGGMVDLVDMPTTEVVVAGKPRPRVSASLLACQLSIPSWIGGHIFAEKVGSMPREGAAGAFTFGYACGILGGVAAGLGIPFTLITPAEWKRAMRCPADKNGARARAAELFPSWAKHFARVKDDGRAEAALLAAYGAGLMDGSIKR